MMVHGEAWMMMVNSPHAGTARGPARLRGRLLQQLRPRAGALLRGRRRLLQGRRARLQGVGARRGHAPPGARPVARAPLRARLALPARAQVVPQPFVF